MHIEPRLISTSGTVGDLALREPPLVYIVPRPIPPHPIPPRDDLYVPELQRRAVQKAEVRLHKSPDDNLSEASVNMPSQKGTQQGTEIGGANTGAGLKGRSTLSQSLQFQNACIAAQQNGDPIPKSCHLTELAHQKDVGPNPNLARWQGDIKAKDADIKYRRDPGNADYWKRVGAAPGPRYEVPDPPAPGAFSNEKDARTHGQVNTH